MTIKAHVRRYHCDEFTLLEKIKKGIVILSDATIVTSSPGADCYRNPAGFVLETLVIKKLCIS